MPKIIWHALLISNLMNKLLSKYPMVTRFTLAIILFASALGLSGLVNKGIMKEYFPYASCIFLGITTWIMYKIDNKSLMAIGLNITKRNILFLPLGILIGALVFLSIKIIRAFCFGEVIAINHSINLATIFIAFYTILPTVAVEEFLFRGYLFKKTIEVSNVVVANIIFSFLFMLIHVFDNNVLNNLGLLIFLLISIPVGHLLFATALLKSRTLFFPIGLHLGNNWATWHLISNTNDGNSILYIHNEASFETWTSFLTFLFIFNGFFILVTCIIWKWEWLKEILTSKR